MHPRALPRYGGVTSSGPLSAIPPIPVGCIHQSGTALLAGAGHPVRLRGVNLGGWLEWQGWEWDNEFNYIGESAMMGLDGWPLLWSSSQCQDRMVAMWKAIAARSGQDLSFHMGGYDAAAKLMNAPQFAGEFGHSSYSDLQKYVTMFNNDPCVAAWSEWTWKQSPGYAALQTIQHTALSPKLINWINNPTRPQPTPAEAQQGMADFINVIRFENTLPDAQMRNIMAAPAPPPASPSSTTTTTTTTPTQTTTTTTATTTTTKPTTTSPVRRRAPRASVARCIAHPASGRRTNHRNATRRRRLADCQWMATVKWDHRVPRG